jgi:hypothetical protein
MLILTVYRANFDGTSLGYGRYNELSDTHSIF